MNYVTPAQMQYFEARYPDPEAALQHVITRAEEYADEHAPNALPSVRAGVARLFLAYCCQPDAGERELIRGAIDALLDLGRAVPCRRL